MKKRFLSSVLVILMLTASIAGCGTGNSSLGGADLSDISGVPADEAVASVTVSSSGQKIERRSFPFRNTINGSSDEDTINLYFVDGGEVPYVSLSEYMPLIGTLYKNDAMGIPEVTYDITHPEDNQYVLARPDNSSQMTVDVEADMIEFLGMDLFIGPYENEKNYLLGMILLAEDGLGGPSNLFRDSGDSYDRIGSIVLTFDLSRYSIDLVGAGDECYMPLQTVNDMLLNQGYVLIFFTGEEVMACPYMSDSINEIYNLPTGEMSQELAEYNYNELRFNLDTFYGLKSEHNITDFEEYFEEIGLYGYLTGKDPKEFDYALRRLLSKYLDDGHSAFINFSYLTGEQDLTSDEAQEAIKEELGTSITNYREEEKEYKTARRKYYPDIPEMDPDSQVSEFLYEEVGDTAIITFDEFTAIKPDYHIPTDLSDPEDTFELISYAHSQITRENSPVRNVVLDLSCNGGGDSNAAIFILAWLQDVGKVTVKNTLTGSQSVCSYEADINFDGKFDDADHLPSDLNLYCLTSKASFSCGNLLPAAFKGSSDITLIGRTTGGGSCIVRPAITAIGTQYQISGTSEISSVRNGSFYNVDQGIEPDFVISKMDTFYDREKLVDFIHGLP